MRCPPAGATSYRAIVPQEGRWSSRVLGLDLALESDRLRLYSGTGPVPELLELALRGEALLRNAIARVEEAEQRVEEEAKRAEAAECQLAELRAELERLRSRR